MSRQAWRRRHLKAAKEPVQAQVSDQEGLRLGKEEVAMTATQYAARLEETEKALRLAQEALVRAAQEQVLLRGMISKRPRLGDGWNSTSAHSSAGEDAGHEEVSMGLAFWMQASSFLRKLPGVLEQGLQESFGLTQLSVEVVAFPLF